MIGKNVFGKFVRVLVLSVLAVMVMLTPVFAHTFIESEQRYFYVETDCINGTVSINIMNESDEIREIGIAITNDETKENIMRRSAVVEIGQNQYILELPENLPSGQYSIYFYDMMTGNELCEHLTIEYAANINDLLYQINNCRDVSELRVIIQSNRDILGLDMRRYYSLRSDEQYEVFRYLLKGQHYDNIADFQSAFDDAVYRVWSSTVGTSGTSGGGSGPGWNEITPSNSPITSNIDSEYTLYVFIVEAEAWGSCIAQVDIYDTNDEKITQYISFDKIEADKLKFAISVKTKDRVISRYTWKWIER